MSDSYHDGCFLCVAVRGVSTLDWIDRPLLLDPRAGVVLAGAGALVPGYALVAPRAHVGSLAEAVTDRRFLRFLDDAVGFVEERFGEITFWEHGGVLAEVPSSACVEHAHLHVAAGSFEFVTGAPVRARGRLLIDTVRQGRGTAPYLLHGGTGRDCVLTDDPAVPQYYRRQLAHAVGKPDHWDYAAVRGEEHAEATMRLLLGNFTGAARR
ncbi:hypothetical protein ACFPM7_13620 [Actinokineospora guangxiensis]|uniref:Diadenosine tetraphosphate (Ap4A) HIT family hydrolase n=1 Tax=Actinokineospora guangxiensis TaxID=1490288 RepID=A0ABW0EP25_9PSEU